jgi:hypothetical protein
MTPNIDEKQISIKLNDFLIGRLDILAENGGLKRNHLMLSFVNLWLSVFETTRFILTFYVANLLRVHEAQMNQDLDVYEHEDSESKPPEKPYPIKLSEADSFKIRCHALKSHITRHQMLKIMIIVGIEELENVTDSKTYRFEDIEKRLFKEFKKIMEKGERAFKAYIK